jgi:hypothetical protein
MIIKKTENLENRVVHRRGRGYQRVLFTKVAEPRFN